MNEDNFDEVDKDVDVDAEDAEKDAEDDNGIDWDSANMDGDTE